MLWRIPVDTHEQRIDIMSTPQGFFAHLQATTSVSGTKVFPGGLRPPAIAKALAEIAGIAEIASSGNSVSPSSAQGPRRAQPADLGRAVAQPGQHLVGMLAVLEAAVRAFNEVFSAHR
jgi:hypothetical protein